MREPYSGDPLEAICEILLTAGPWTYGKDHDLLTVASEWLDAGFKPQEAHDWLITGRCFLPKSAQKLHKAGIDPDLAGLNPLSLKTPPQASQNATLGYLFANGDLSLQAALNATAALRQAQTWKLD